MSRTISAVIPVFGSNRTNAPMVGELLGPLKWCAVPFLGGGTELPHIRTNAGVASDLNRHAINLCRVIREHKAELAERLNATLFHEAQLRSSQTACLIREALVSLAHVGDEPDVEWARAYFISCWMGRSAEAGTGGEFKSGLSTRWTSSGGDSAKRYYSAVDALDAWQAAMRPWSFVMLDAFKVIEKANDTQGHGIYCDPPWVDVGDAYTHKFAEADHRRLAEHLSRFQQARVVVRYGDHPLIRELYPEDGWEWHVIEGRNQANNNVREALIVKKEPRE